MVSCMFEKLFNSDHAVDIRMLLPLKLRFPLCVMFNVCSV
jgi:hypothetical protein